MEVDVSLCLTEGVCGGGDGGECLSLICFFFFFWGGAL